MNGVGADSKWTVYRDGEGITQVVGDDIHSSALAGGAAFNQKVDFVYAGTEYGHGGREIENTGLRIAEIVSAGCDIVQKKVAVLITAPPKIEVEIFICGITVADESVSARA